MAIITGSNIAALRAIRDLDGSQELLSRTFERLSSGARINRASDDPAGLGVSSVLSNKARVFTRARLNVSDAVSLLNIADSSLEQVSGMLARMAELAEQSANGSFSAAQRANLQAEYNSLEKEMRRMNDSTRFNGLNPLRGGKSSRAIQTLIDDPAMSVSVSQTTGDGRYVSAYSTTDGYHVLDTTTGQKRSLSIGSATYVRLLSNGDAVLGTLEGSTTSLYRVNFETGETNMLARVTTSFADYIYGDAVSVAADGSTAVFVSRYNYADGSSAGTTPSEGATYRYFSLDLETGAIRSISSLATGNAGPSFVSSNGRYAALYNNSSSSYSIVDLQNPSQTPTNVLSVTSSSTIAGISDTGALLFTSTSNLTGDNPNGYRQFFSAQAGTGSITQISNFSATYSFTALKASFDGSMVYFRSTGDLTGENSSNARQVFALDTLSRSITQRTNGNVSSLSGSLVISADGSKYYGVDSTTQYAYGVDITPGASTYDFEVGSGAVGRIASELDALFSSVRGIGGHSITSKLSARVALDKVRENIENISALRGKLGAAMSRITIAGELLDSQRNEILAANSRIVDADIAAEMAQLTRQRILQQVGSAVLAQANQQPALASVLLS